MPRNDLEEPAIRPDGLQIDDDTAGQERAWIAERIAHVVFLAFVGVALLGLTGANGPFATAEASSAGGHVAYTRIGRWQTTSDVNVTFAADRPRHRLELTTPHWDTLTLEQVQPQPARATAIPGGVVFEFDAAGPGAMAALRIRPEYPGPKRLSLTLDDAAPIVARTFVLP